MSSKLEVLAEGLGLAFAASGATVAAVLGKFIVGVVLAALAIGFLLRLKGRKSRAGSAAVAQNPQPTTTSRLVTGLISAVEVAALVEATNLPIRFDQSGFQMSHWFLVLLVFCAAYFLQQPLVLRLLNKPRQSGAA